jgi:exonuclease SbcC
LRARSLRTPELEAELVRIRHSLEELDTLGHKQEQPRARLLELQSQVHHLTEVNGSLRGEMDDLRKKVDLLQESRGPEGGGARCPLCNQELEEEGCEHLAATYEAEGRRRAASHRENEATIREMESERAGLERELAAREAEFQRLRADTQRQYDALVRETEEAKAATEMVGQLQSSLESEGLLVEAGRKRLEEVQAAMPPLREAASALPATMNAYQERRAQLDGLRGRQTGLHRDLGDVQGRLERSRELERLRQEKGEALATASEQKGVYDQLSAAFGKGGIQALLIEQALPELETQANEILGRLTDHRMNLKLETQRERRSGGDPRETLDIKISDELGTRSYETYSGGEAFRINFAIRIALSKLLAHRSGAPLPTLFIDEGFGTQDAFGLEKLVEAINAIQDDFQRIVVITHIEELKEAFPVRIEVTKTPQGSTFWMS